MFGYVRPVLEKLSPEEQDRFQSVYCGLCHALPCGIPHRLAFILGRRKPAVIRILCLALGKSDRVIVGILGLTYHLALQSGRLLLRVGDDLPRLVLRLPADRRRFLLSLRDFLHIFDCQYTPSFKLTLI